MALVTERFIEYRGGLFFVDITYEDTNDRVEQVHAECHVPSGVHVSLYRGGSAQPWREATLADGEVFGESRPFGGGFNTLDQIEGYRTEIL